MISRLIMCARRHGRVRLSQAPGRLGVIPNPARAEKPATARDWAARRRGDLSMKMEASSSLLNLARNPPRSSPLAVQACGFQREAGRRSDQSPATIPV